MMVPPASRGRQVQVEYLAPAELDAALAEAPVAFLPLGSLEFHGSHLPIGLDALNALGVCIAAARRTGGLVFPPVYQSLGGGHSDYPWTIMMPSAEGIRSNLLYTLRRLEEFGFRQAVLFTGHFADEQLLMIDELAAEWEGSGDHSMGILATGVNRCPDAPLAPDHAGIFETSLFHSLWPKLVHLDRLPSLAENPAVDPGGDPAGPQRHDSRHPLWGIFGPDPRLTDLRTTDALRESLVRWLSALVRERMA